MPLRSQHIQETEHATDDFLCPQGIPLPSYLFSSKDGLAIAIFLTIQPADVFQHLFRIQGTVLLVCIHELGTRMSQAANTSSVPLKRHSLSVVIQFASEDRLSPASALHFVSFAFESSHSDSEAARSYGRASPEATPFLPCQPCARKKAHRATLIFP